MRIYADHNATSPLLPQITEQFESLVCAPFAAADLARARERVAAWLDAPAEGVIFTASATEANAFALRGHLSASGKSVSLISAIEHPSVTENAAGEVRLMPAFRDGVVTLRELSGDVGVVSVMWANNETGAVQPVKEIAALCRASGVRLHIDAVQAAGKLPVSLRELGADSYTVSAHKLGAPPGAAALIVCGREPANARIGEEPHHPAILFSYAAEAWREHGDVWRKNMRAARDAFEETLLSGMGGEAIVAKRVERLPNTSCMLLPGVRGQAVLSALDLAGISVSHGSACATGSLDPSPVLLAMGLSTAEARSAIRVSFGPHASADEGRTVARELLSAVMRLRGVQN